MSNMPNDKKNTSKGFYIALSACVVALIVAVLVGINKTVTNINNNTPKVLDNISSTTEQVDKNEDSIPVKEESETSDESQQQNVEDTAVDPASEVEKPQETTGENVEEEMPTAATIQFARPLEGDIINKFSNGELVKSKTLNEWRTHDGIDIKSNVDAPVKAACSGIVEEVIEDPLWGTCITISHDGNYQTFYKGLAPNTNVQKSQRINLGDVIGYVGTTAEIEIAEETHIHFAVKQNGEWLDPEVLF